MVKISDEFKVVIILLCIPWAAATLGMMIGAKHNERALTELEASVARSNRDILESTRRIK
jgi:hypothetical protein